jgi:sirohydrochlorin cobaltochelatase
MQTMKKSLLTAVLSALFVTGSLLISGTAVYAEAEETADAEYIYEEYDEEYEEEEGDEAEEIVNPDQEAADQAAALIDAICAEEWTEETDALVGEARAAWEALTDLQKEMVAGEAADPDYFGLDTGDASLDDPLNADGIGEKELLVVSFGTSYNDSRRLTIGAIEKKLAEEFPDYSVRRAFTSQIIIDHVQSRDKVKIDNVKEALDRAVANNVKTLVVQPTHLMKDGLEYTDLVNEIADYADAFEHLEIAEPLLTEEADFEAVAAAITEATAQYDDGETAICFMGHGTEAESNMVYSKMQTLLTDKGFANYYVGTVEAEPTLEDLLALVKQGSYKKVVLEPLMVVAGDHANNDMAGDEDGSWKKEFENAGYEVECLLQGLGENEAIRGIYVEHSRAAIERASE